MKSIKLFVILLFLIVIFGCSNNASKYETKTVNGEEFIVYEGLEYPSVFGEPKLTIEEIQSLDKVEAQDKISTYIDYLIYTKDTEFNSTEEWINNTYGLLAGDYDEIGIINRSFSYLLYLKINDKYYPIDIHNYDKEWLSNYMLDVYSYDSTDELCKVFKGAAVKKTDCKVLWTKGDDIPIDGYKFVELVNGEKVGISIRLGTEVYEFAGSQIPLGLGLPEYTNDEIDQIIKEEDYASVASKINTLADAINYVKRSGFLFENNSVLHTYQDIIYVDVGNLNYIDEDNFVYTVSGLEMLQLKFGQCTASSSLFNYLLKDDYKEVGYVRTQDHAMIYILGNDDMYYLIDPSTYLLYENEVYDEKVCDRQHLHWAFNVENYECSSTSLEGLMQNFIDCPSKPQDYNSEFIMLVTYVYDGVCCIGFGNDNRDWNSLVFPEGSIVNVWYGDIKYSFKNPTHNTSQEYVIGLPTEGTIFINR